MTGYRVGIDVGGTFTDLICVTPDGTVILDKTPTTPDDQSVGVMNGLELLATHVGLPLGELCGRLDALVHGTTTADNTMIEMDGAPTGLLVTEGHRDEIEMRRVHKEEIWDPSYPAPPPIARRRARIPIPERLDVDGNVVLPLDEDAVRNGVRRLRKLGCTSIAVVFLHSFTNPAHELREGAAGAAERDDTGAERQQPERPRARRHGLAPEPGGSERGERRDEETGGEPQARPAHAWP